MADVQLEYGYIRIANALFEAMGYADFTISQYKIMIVLIRLTYGWSRQTVRLSVTDLCERCGLRFSGGFRRALDDLIRYGIVIEVQPALGRTPSVWAIQKDFEKWGAKSVPSQAMAWLYAERPSHLPAVVVRDVPRPASAASTETFVYYARSGNHVKIGFSRDPWGRVASMRTVRPDTELIAVEPGDRATERERHVTFSSWRVADRREWFLWCGEIEEFVETLIPEGGERWPAMDMPPQGQEPPLSQSQVPAGAGDMPHEEARDEPSDSADNELQAGKDFKPDSHTSGTTTAREGLNSIKLVVAANRGLAEHPKRPQQIPRILPGQGSTVEAVEQLEAADVPQAFAEGAIYELAKAHRSTTEVRGLLYFVAATVRQWEEAKVAEAVKSSPAPAAIARAGSERKGPTWDQRNASRDVERAREERRATLDRRYAAERKEAIARWKATNAEQYAVVEAEVKADTGLFVTGGPSGQAMLDRMIEIALVDRFQCFPSADEWLEQQRVSA